MSSKRRPLAESPTATFSPLPHPSSSPISHKPKKLKISSSPSPSFNNAAPGDPSSSLISGEVPAALNEGDKESEDIETSWTRVEKRKSKKARKIEARLDGNPPRFFYVNNEIVKRKEAVGVSDVRDLVLHLLGETAPPPWLKVENRNAIQKVVTLFIPGLLPEHLVLPPLPTSATANPNLPLPIPLPPAPESQTAGTFSQPEVKVKTLFGGEKTITVKPSLTSGVSGEVASPRLPFIAKTFSHACPTRAPGDALRMHSVLSAFFQGPVTAEEKKRRAMRTTNVEASTSDAPSRYVLTPAQMLANEYPLPTYMMDSSIELDAGEDATVLDEGWIESPRPFEGSGSPEVYAIDCEMCLTEAGKELTRVCMVEYSSGKVVLDRLVKPQRKILDYLTRWSGITEEALRNVDTTLEDVQKEILDLLTSPKHKRTPILLGHSLEIDLKALRIAHPLVIDTALIYHHPKGRPLKPGLAWLIRKWCGREIQNRGEGGHDAEEDARACIDLLDRKIWNGPTFGEFKADHESIFERLSRGRVKPRTAVIDRGNPSTWHGSGATTCVGCTNDEEILSGVLANMDSSDFIWARFTGLAEAQGWLQPRQSQTDTGLTNADTASIDKLTISSDDRETVMTDALNKLDKQLASLHAALPPKSALVVFTGHGDPRKMAELQARKGSFENALRSGGVINGSSTAGTGVSADSIGIIWTMGDSRSLEEAVEQAKRGLLFLCMT